MYYPLHIWQLKKSLISPPPEYLPELYHLSYPPSKERRLPIDLQLVDKASEANVHCYRGICCILLTVRNLISKVNCILSRKELHFLLSLDWG